MAYRSNKLAYIVAVLAFSAAVGPIAGRRLFATSVATGIPGVSWTLPQAASNAIGNAGTGTGTDSVDLTKGFGVQFSTNYGYGAAIPGGLVAATNSKADTASESIPIGVVSDPITSTSAIDVTAVPYSGAGVAANGGVGTSYNWFGKTGFLGIQGAIAAAIGKGTAASLSSQSTPSGNGGAAIASAPSTTPGALASVSAATNVINKGKPVTVQVIPFVKRPYTKTLPPFNYTGSVVLPVFPLAGGK